MRSFTDSSKSKKTVASMIERKGDTVAPKKSVKIVEAKKEEYEVDDYDIKEDMIAANRKKMMEKLSGKKKTEIK